jgi:2-polyprenyl-3-methyl-5-hydroxy-6-metoxy-1,4-benzoquinol methylase
MNESQDYPLGYSEQEARRLAEQGALLEDFTADVLRRAGLRQGMRVLDIGCGVGDVSLLAARVVGREGAVLGIDRALTSLETARRRLASSGVTTVRFAQADLATFETEQTFHAIVGRLVLLYLPDPGATLRRLVRALRPGGIVAFQEFDMSQVSQTPASELFLQARRWIMEAFVAGGAQVDMGTRLYATFLRAGLPAPEMIAGAFVAAGPRTPGYRYMVDVLRSLLPLVERSGIAKIEDIGIETLARRLLDDAIANERVAFMPRVVGAWAAVAQNSAG